MHRLSMAMSPHLIATTVCPQFTFSVNTIMLSLMRLCLEVNRQFLDREAAEARMKHQQSRIFVYIVVFIDASVAATLQRAVCPAVETSCSSWTSSSR
ncbi:hypothetical protein BD309DRAFT_959867 [Dichomitus squalens]|nr:hypothetical protein BD309DRAFT_959867 [Dichomitus squalens]